ncbi:MAG: immunoglobulin domain-containing protein [Verrucomicrobiota bacterium]
MKKNDVRLKLNAPPKCFRSFFRQVASLALLVTTCLSTLNAHATTTSLVIAEVYGGGGNSGATLKNDFIVIFNPSAAGVDVNGWSVQYQSSTTNVWTGVTPLATSSTIIPPGGYFLVQETNGAGGTVNLPTPDAMGTIPMSATAAKIALCNSTNVLSGTNSTGPTIVDFVGYGSAANSFEGSGPTPTLSNTTSAQRKSNGCVDTENNSADFTVGAPNPRNSSSPINVCNTSGPPSISSQPQSRTNNAGTTATFTVNAGGAEPLVYLWRKNGVDLIDGATGSGSTISGSGTSLLTISNVFAGDAGGYSVFITNSVGSTNSATATLTVIDPVITFQPLSRTILVGDAGIFRVTAAGTGLSYQWNFNGTDIPGATTNVYGVLDSQLTNQGTYSVVVSGLGVLTSSNATLTVLPRPANKIAQWYFNLVTTPSTGSGTVATIGGAAPTAPAFAAGSDSDPAGLGDSNFGWGTSTYPAQGTENKTRGIQVNVSTVGNKNILLSWEQRNSATASKYARLQYSTDGVSFIDHNVLTMSVTNNSFLLFTSDLSAVTGVNDNPNFAFRIVTETELSALGTGTANYIASTPGSTYGTGGTIRFDVLSVYGNDLSSISPIPLNIQRDGSNVVLTWSDPAFALQAALLVTGTYTNIPGATSPYTNAIGGSQLYFRLKN